MRAEQRWAEDLTRWGIPDWILNQALRSPWLQPVPAATQREAAIIWWDFARQQLVDPTKIMEEGLECVVK